MTNQTSKMLEKDLSNLNKSEAKIRARIQKLQSDLDEAREDLKRVLRAKLSLISDKDKHLLVKKEPKRLGP